MSISKISTSATLAFAFIGGAIVLAPSNVEAAGKKSSSKFIKYEVLKPVPCSKRGSSSSNRKIGPPANDWNRGCSDITRCNRK